MLVRSGAVADHQVRDTDFLGREVVPRLSLWIIAAVMFKGQSPEGVRGVLLGFDSATGIDPQHRAGPTIQSCLYLEILKSHIPRKIFKSLEKSST